MKNMTTLAFILNGIADGSIECSDELRAEYVEKARHALRNGDGKFRPMNDHENNIPDDSLPIPVRHSGAVLDVLRRKT